MTNAENPHGDDRRPRVAAASLGCKLNTCEAEATRAAFERAGCRIVPFGEPAEIYIVHTCTVTGRADYRSRNLLRRAARAVTPGGRVVACGCYAVTDPAELARIEGVTDVVAGPAPELVERFGPAAAPAPDWPLLPRGFSRLTRAFLKVQDGCDGACSYCKVRLARGRARSRPAAGARRALELLVAAGHREVALTGVHLGAWGREFGAGLPELLRVLLPTPGLDRLQLSSIEPLELTTELLELLAAEERLAPHLHVPLQSGSDGILRAMNRGYGVEEALERIAAARERVPNLGLGLDVIVGFPGETAEDFAATRDAVEASGAAYLHVFSYSPRPGTPAAELPDQVDEEVKSARSRELRRLSVALARRFGAQRLGRELEVLVERRPGRAGRRAGVSGEYLRCELLDPSGDDTADLGGRLVRAEALELLGPPPDSAAAGPATLLCRRRRPPARSGS